MTHSQSPRENSEQASAVEAIRHALADAKAGRYLTLEEFRRQTVKRHPVLARNTSVQEIALGDPPGSE